MSSTFVDLQGLHLYLAMPNNEVAGSIYIKELKKLSRRYTFVEKTRIAGQDHLADIPKMKILYESRIQMIFFFFNKFRQYK